MRGCYNYMSICLKDQLVLFHSRNYGKPDLTDVLLNNIIMVVIFKWSRRAKPVKIP